MKQPTRVLNGLLVNVLCAALWGQSMPKEISLTVIEGEGVVNRLRQRASHDPAVRVEDEEHRPISGAAVVFTLPVSGTTGEFVNGSKNLTVVTDKDGVAVAQGLRTNDVPGKLQIHVTASYRGLRARILVNQFTMAPSGTDISRKSGGHGKTWAVLAVIGAAAAAGGAVAATHKSGTTPQPGPTTPTVPAAITISPGSGSVGAPPR